MAKPLETYPWMAGGLHTNQAQMVAPNAVGGHTFGIHPSNGRGGLSREQEMMLWYGQPAARQQVDPYDAYAVPDRTWPFVNKDRAGQFIRNVLIHQISQAESFWTDIAPFKPFDGLHVTVSRLEFTNHALDAVPEKGVPRMVTQRMERYTRTMERRGLGFQMEKTFAMTPEGRMHYAMNILQIRNAVWTHLAMCFFGEFLNGAPQPRTYYDIVGLPPDRQTLEALFEEEAMTWAILHKSKVGFGLMEHTAKNIFMSRDVIPDTLIIPQGARMRCTLDPQHYEFFHSGQAPKTTFGNIDSIPRTSQMRVYEAVKYAIDDNVVVDPLARTRVIGEFFQMFDHARDMPPGQYRSWFRNISIHDNRSDSVVEIQFLDALKKSGLFQKKPDGTYGGLSRDIGQPFFASWVYFQDYVREVAPELLGLNAGGQLLFGEASEAPEASSSEDMDGFGGNMGTYADDGAILTQGRRSLFVHDVHVLQERAKDTASKHALEASVWSEALISTMTEFAKERYPSLFNHAGIFVLGLLYWHALDKKMQLEGCDTPSVKFCQNADPILLKGLNVLDQLYEYKDAEYETMMAQRHTPTRKQEAMHEQLDEVSVWLIKFASSGHNVNEILTDMSKDIAEKQTEYAKKRTTRSSTDEEEEEKETEVNPAVFPELIQTVLDSVEHSSFSPETVQAAATALHNMLKEKVESKLAAFEETAAPGKRSHYGGKKCQDLTFQDFQFLHQNDIPVPIHLLLFRPHMAYNMSSAIACKRGAATAGTYFGNADFDWGGDTTRKMRQGNFTCYCGVVLENAANVQVLHNVQCNYYRGGGGVRFWDPQDREDVRTYRSGTLNKDIFVIAVPYGYRQQAGWVDITGHLPSSVLSRACDPEAGDDFSYPSAGIYANVWGWNNEVSAEYMDVHFNRDPHAGMLMNTRCAQGSQYLPKPCSNERQPRGLHIAGRGHWGPFPVYDGIRRDREGKGVHMFIRDRSNQVDEFVGNLISL